MAVFHRLETAISGGLKLAHREIDNVNYFINL